MVIKLITFKSGLVILGKVSYTIGFISVKEPLAVYAQPSQDGRGNVIGFTPFLDYTEEFSTGIEFKEEDTLTINTPVNDMINQYNKVFGAGIEIVSSLKK